MHNSAIIPPLDILLKEHFRTVIVECRYIDINCHKGKFQQGRVDLLSQTWAGTGSITVEASGRPPCPVHRTFKVPQDDF